MGPITNYRNYKNLYQLYGTKCTACGKLFYPKAHLCSCGATDFEDTKLSGRGTLVTFTSVVHPPVGFATMAPYCLGIIELEEGVRVLAQIADASLDELSIGMLVTACFRKLYEEGEAGVIQYGIKFVLNKQ